MSESTPENAGQQPVEIANQPGGTSGVVTRKRAATTRRSGRTRETSSAAGTTRPATTSRAAGLAPGKRHPSPLSRPLDYWLLWLVVIGSLALNLYLVRTLLEVQTRAREVAGQVSGQVSEALQDAGSILDSIRGATITYTAEIDESIPVDFSVEINKVVIVPISTTVPIDMIVSVPLPSILGLFPPIRVPVSETIPVKFTTEVPINLTVPISETVPVQFDVPIEIAVAETPFADVIDQIDQFLSRLSPIKETIPWP